MPDSDRHSPTAEAEALRDVLSAIRTSEQALASAISPNLRKRVQVPLDFNDAALLVRSFHAMMFHLPYLFEILESAKSPDGRDIVEIDDSSDARDAAIRLYKLTEKMTHSLDPHSH